MKKIFVYVIILFVIVGLSGIIYLFNLPSIENSYVKDLNQIESQNMQPQIQDIEINQQDVSDNLKIETLYTLKEIEKHNSKESCWSIIRKDVYDLTQWISRHPGGEKVILNICGKDGTAFFEKQHGGKDKPESTLLQFKIGKLLEQ